MRDRSVVAERTLDACSSLRQDVKFCDETLIDENEGTNVTRQAETGVGGDRSNPPARLEADGKRVEERVSRREEVRGKVGRD